MLLETFLSHPRQVLTREQILGRLTLRARMALLTAAAVALAVAACATAGWLLTRNQLYQELDRRLAVTSGGPPGGPGHDEPFRGPRIARQMEEALAVCSQTPTASAYLPPGPFEMMQLSKPAPPAGRRSSSAPPTPPTPSPSTRPRPRCGRWRSPHASSASTPGASWSRRR